MPEKNEPVCFVRNGNPTLPDEDPSFLCFHGYRRLPPGWTAEAVERVKGLLGTTHYSINTGGTYGSVSSRKVTDAEILAALFPPSEPEPPDWAIRAAHTLGHAAAHEDEHARRCEKCMAWARIIAKHAGGAK